MKTGIAVLLIVLLGFESVYSKRQAGIKNGMGSSQNMENTDTTVDNASKVVPVYFILGTLSDYIGRFYFIDRSQQVDKYDGPEKPIVDYLGVMIKDQMGMTIDSLIEKESRYTRKKYLMYSDQLSTTLNNFYGKEDKLIDSLFTTDEQIYSFLAGVYYRYGDQLDSSIYKIQMANSSKHINCQAFLEKVGCKKVVYKHLNHIPGQHILYFTPTTELLHYFNGIEQEKRLLNESSLKALQEIFKETSTKEDLEKGFRDLKVNELNRIKGEFNQ